MPTQHEEGANEKGRQRSVVIFSSSHDIKDLPNLEGYISKVFNEEKADVAIFTGTVGDALRSGFSVWEKPDWMKDMGDQESSRCMLVCYTRDNSVPLLYIEKLEVRSARSFVRLSMLKAPDAN